LGYLFICRISKNYEEFSWNFQKWITKKRSWLNVESDRRYSGHSSVIIDGLTVIWSETQKWNWKNSWQCSLGKFRQMNILVMTMYRFQYGLAEVYTLMSVFKLFQQQHRCHYTSMSQHTDPWQTEILSCIRKITLTTMKLLSFSLWADFFPFHCCTEMSLNQQHNQH